LRDYGVDGQIGLESSPQEFVQTLADVFREVKRILKPTGTLWLNLGDSYTGGGGFSPNAPSNKTSRAGQRGTATYGVNLGVRKNTNLKPKNLLGMPWRVAFALQDDGWILRSEIIWHKPNAMPESVTDRPTKAHETVFLFSKQVRYFYDAEAVREQAVNGKNRSSFRGGGTYTNNNSFNNHSKVGSDLDGIRPDTQTRNCRDVWSVSTQPYPGSHFATFPEKLVEPMILAGCPVGGTVLDPFGGSGTTARVANRHGRNAVLIELNPTYHELIKDRVESLQTSCVAS